MNNQQRPTVQHRELCPVLHGRDFPGGAADKESICQCRGNSSSSGPGRSHIMQSHRARALKQKNPPLNEKSIHPDEE